MGTYNNASARVSYKNKIRIKQQQEADDFNALGMTKSDLRMEWHMTSNPLLKAKISEILRERDIRKKRSLMQNKESLAILDELKVNALGVGLRKVIKTMKKDAKMNKNKESLALYLLLSIEFANLEAKRLRKGKSKMAYERKEFLLEDIEPLLCELGWRHGANNASGKNAQYLFYIYLPNGSQLTWHGNDFYLYQQYPYIEDAWDGQVCSTLKKLIEYVGSRHRYFKAA